MIILDRKKKMALLDKTWDDPFSIEEVKKEKARTIEARTDSDSPIHKFLCKWGDAKLLLGKTAHCLKSDKSVMSGRICDVMPPNYIHLKGKGVATFDDCIALGD